MLRQRLDENVQIPDVTELEEVVAMLTERLPLFSEKWISEGRKEGRMEGEAKGRAAILNRLLTKRFGKHIVDLHLEDRLINSSPEQLDVWAERILDAKTIDDVFSDKA